MEFDFHFLLDFISFGITDSYLQIVVAQKFDKAIFRNSDNPKIN